MDWKRFFDSIGLNGTHWQWRVMRWQRSWERLLERARLKKPIISDRHKFCERCGALLERADRECVRCGARAPSYHVQAARRRMAALLPANPATFFLAMAFVLIALLGLAPGVRRAVEAAGMWHSAYAVGDGQWWRALSYAWLHGGLMHLLFNTIALVQVGGILERAVGSARYFVVFTLTALSAALLFYLVGGVSMVGASGSLFGLIGLGLAHAHFYGGAAGREMRNFFLQWAVYGILFGVFASMGGGMRIANSAHIGGFVLGLALGWLVERDLRRPERWARAWRFLAFACLALNLVAIGFAARLAILLLPQPY